MVLSLVLGQQFSQQPKEESFCRQARVPPVFSYAWPGCASHCVSTATSVWQHREMPWTHSHGQHCFVHPQASNWSLSGFPFPPCFRMKEQKTWRVLVEAIPCSMVALKTMSPVHHWISSQFCWSQNNSTNPSIWFQICEWCFFQAFQIPGRKRIRSTDLLLSPPQKQWHPQVDQRAATIYKKQQPIWFFFFIYLCLSFLKLHGEMRKHTRSCRCCWRC